MLFGDKQSRVKRNIFKNQTGGEFDQSVKDYINLARLHIAREARWTKNRVILEPAFSTVGDFTTGTCTFTNDSKTVSAFSSSLITQGVEPGQRIENTTSGASSTVFTIVSVDSASQVTLDKPYDATTGASQTFKILGQERYTLPIHLTEISFIWHEDFGNTYVLDNIGEREFFFDAYDRNSTNTPTGYYLADPFGVDRQPSAASAISIVSSSNDSSDQSSAGVKVIIEGIVSSVPDFEELTLNGTTRVDGTKSFSFITKIYKTKTTAGRITVSDAIPSAGSGSTLATLPANLSYAEPIYKRIGLWPIPDDDDIPINIWGYRAPKQLVNNNDASEWGLEFDLLEILYASYLGSIGEHQKDETNAFFNAYVYELSKLKKKNVDRIDSLPSFARHGTTRYRMRSRSLLHPRLAFSQLGPKFGPMSR